MLGQQAAVFANEKAGSEDVELKVWAVAVEVELYIPFVIEQGFAELVHGDEQRLAGATVEKFDDHMEQTDARTVGLHNCFGDFAVALDATEPVLRFGKLAAQVCVAAAAARRHFLF